ncbi:uncharacterized protein METZ01_LOCUS19048 [marine metagenome]|uniref:Uncharacterized protein n=1 Tax=marine metagenome TaxID=408172 RepID=A0A381PHT9_9ZZZZ
MDAVVATLIGSIGWVLRNIDFLSIVDVTQRDRRGVRFGDSFTGPSLFPKNG